MTDQLEMLANILLFLSSLLLLIDVAPRDFLPSHKRRVRAVAELRQHRNIVGPVPAVLELQPEGDVNVTLDEPTYRTLVEFLKQRSPLAGVIEWNRAIGVGYAAISFPLGIGTLEAFRGVYVMLQPQGGTTLELAPVAQLDDLEVWLRQWRQGNLTKTAFVLLAAGFFLQLWPALNSLL